MGTPAMDELARTAERAYAAWAADVQDEEKHLAYTDARDKFVNARDAVVEDGEGE